MGSSEYLFIEGGSWLTRLGAFHGNFTVMRKEQQLIRTWTAEGALKQSCNLTELMR